MKYLLLCVDYRMTMDVEVGKWACSEQESELQPFELVAP